MRILLVMTLVASVGLAQQTSTKPEWISITKTETATIPAGGLLTIDNSVGELTIDAWDKPGVEITTIKRSKHPVAGKEREDVEAVIAKVKITAEAKGDGLTITTDFPHEFRMKSFDGTPTAFDLRYELHVPRTTRIHVVKHSGEVHIDEVRGDIDAHVREGEITLHLPDDGKYAVDARSKFGNISSDFAGDERHRWWGTTRYLDSTPQGATQKLKLRVGYGDVVILGTHTPPLRP